MAAPGVSVTTATRSGPSSVVRAPSGQYFVVGLAERGPVDAPVQINSMADYKRIFGERATYGSLYDDLMAFFETGGSQAQVLRIVGAAATSGTLSLDDGSSAETLRVDAASAGSWSSRVTVQVEEGALGATTRKVTVRLDGQIVEVYNNLATVGDIVSRFGKSPYVRFTALGSVSADTLPAVVAATPLSVGSDDRASVNAARIESRLQLFRIGLGDGAIGAPGFGASVHTALIEHAKENRRIAILTGPKGSSVGDLAALGIGLATTPGSEHAGLFGGHLQVSDGAGGVRTISPEGYVAACRSRAHEVYGPWAAPAGELAVTPYILGVDVDFTREDAEMLSSARVNPIRTVQGRVRLYDWRSLSANETDFASLSVQDLLNRLVTECEARLEPYVFRTIDGKGHLLSEMTGVLVGILEPIRTAGGIFERTDPVSREVLDPGYSVDVSPAINQPASLAQNRVNAQVAVRPSPNASLITLTIVKAGLTAAV